MEKTRVNLYISCMDRRLNEISESHNDGNTVFLRNAGANASALKKTIKEIKGRFDLGRVVIAPHSDCGAMKVIYTSIKEGKETSSEIYKSLVRQFENAKFSSIQELEQINAEVQKKSLEKIVGKDASEEFIDLERISIPKEKSEHVLIVLAPSKTKYSSIFARLGLDPYSTYVIQGSQSEIGADIEIAIRHLFIKKVYVLSDEGEVSFDAQKVFDSIKERYAEADVKLV
ncbi:MAG: carbonic anhydrase [Candidatus Micrarchaeaceae archaeon]